MIIHGFIELALNKRRMICRYDVNYLVVLLLLLLLLLRLILTGVEATTSRL